MRTHSYRITIAGGLGEIGREAFGDFRIEADDGDTVLIGYLDQAALYGTLNRILSLGFELVELRRLPDQTTPEALRAQAVPLAESLAGSSRPRCAVVVRTLTVFAASYDALGAAGAGFEAANSRLLGG